MTYICLTQQTANWLLARTTYWQKLAELLLDGLLTQQLRKADLINGGIRLSGSADGKLIAIWHSDYLSGTGNEEWGFIKLSGSLGIESRKDIGTEVFERCIYIINQRLQRLLIGSAYYHRSYANGGQTCMAGRGEVARRSSIGYFETDVEADASRNRTILCLGPAQEYEPLALAAVREGGQLELLVQLANALIAPQKRRPILDSSYFPSDRNESIKGNLDSPHEFSNVIANLDKPATNDVYRSQFWKFEDWIKNTSTLSPIQRRILNDDGLLKHPLRIMGPGGSGKTLLMQLLAMRRLNGARLSASQLSVLYVVHNAAMVNLVVNRFISLGATDYLTDSEQSLRVMTLADYGKAELQVADTAVIDPDAHGTKLFQLTEVKKAIRTVFGTCGELVSTSPLLSQVNKNEDLFIVFAYLVMMEISTAIKGHGMKTGDKQRYIGTQRPLSRFHGLLSLQDRGVVFDIFQHYHTAVFEQYEVLDSDDIALSLLGKMRTPIWELKRKVLGFDFVFVDETQLFNENERRIFPLLTKGNTAHAPIALALDEAQALYGQSSAGFGALGIDAISNESLPTTFRSTIPIINLAFFILQQTTDLFAGDFPDFTKGTTVMPPSPKIPPALPLVKIQSQQNQNFYAFVVDFVINLKNNNLRQIAVICHAEQYWEGLHDAFVNSPLPLFILEQRGQLISPTEPVVALTRVAYVGGQEFDAVVVIGLEQGVVPPRVIDNESLAAAVEQQALREMYLSFTRARYKLIFLVSYPARPTKVLQEAIGVNLIHVES